MTITHELIEHPGRKFYFHLNMEQFVSNELIQDINSGSYLAESGIDYIYDNFIKEVEKQRLKAKEIITNKINKN